MRIKLLGSFFALLLLAGCQGDTGEGDGSVQPVGPQPGTQEDLVTNVGDRVFYDFDSSVLDAADKVQLDKIAAWLKTYPNVNVVIEGHCDPRGTREYNYALGYRRANAAMAYLVTKGIDAQRMKTTSFGKDRPAVLGDTEEAWKQDRRAVTVVTSQ